MAVLANADRIGEEVRSLSGEPPAGGADRIGEEAMNPCAPWAAYSGLTLTEGDPFGRHLIQDAGRDDAAGNIVPGLKLRYGRYRFRLAVDAGDRTVSVSALQPVTSYGRPKLVVIANPDIGLSANLTATATSATGWQTLTTAEFTATADGAVWVELVNPDGHACWFDNLAVN